MLGQASVWTGFDTVINSWCILLSFAQHNRLYFKICGPFHRHVLKCAKCLSCSECACCRIDAVRNSKDKMEVADNTYTISASVNNPSLAVYDVEMSKFSSLRRRNNVNNMDTIYENKEIDEEEKYCGHDNGVSKTDDDKQKNSQCISMEGIEESDKKCIYICAGILCFKICVFFAVLIVYIMTIL